MSPIQVSIVEDMPDIREGLQLILRQTPELNCLSVFDNAEEALPELFRQKPDVVVMDINLPGISGIDCVRQLKSKGLATQFLMFTVFENDEAIFDALSAGANGYVLKKMPPHKIVEAIRELHEGGSPMSASIARRVLASFQSKPVDEPTYELSPREKEIVIQLAKGLLYKEIAEQLSIGIGTVRQHIHHIYEKLHVQNRTEALNKLFNK
ncbi:MAG: response regulator transcription factor [Bacteroidota bacterium]